MNDATATYRVVCIGSGRQPRPRLLGRMGLYEAERTWRRRLAQEMEAACQEMARRGLRLVQVVPLLSTATWQGTWTEGAWLYFGPASPGSTPRTEVGSPWRDGEVAQGGQG